MFKVEGLGFRVHFSGFRVQDLWFRVQGLAFWELRWDLSLRILKLPESHDSETSTLNPKP